MLAWSRLRHFFCLSFVSKLITERIRETLQFSSCCHHVAMPRNWGAKRDTAFFIYRLPIFHNISMHFYKTFYIYTYSSHIHYICNNSILCIIYLYMILLVSFTLDSSSSTTFLSFPIFSFSLFLLDQKRLHTAIQSTKPCYDKKLSRAQTLLLTSTARTDVTFISK